MAYQLWNASTGECYEINDVRCPLHSIGCLIDDSNVLANVQKEDHPSKLDMNLANVKAWRPFFSRAYPNPGLFSVQMETPNYHETDVQYFTNLQDKLERLLKDKLMEWRPRFVTRWNSDQESVAHANQSIRVNQSLPSAIHSNDNSSRNLFARHSPCDYSDVLDLKTARKELSEVMSPTNSSVFVGRTKEIPSMDTNIEQKFAMGQTIEDHRSELDQVISSYKLTGFPLQMQYTDTQPVLDAVYSTGVHNCEDPDVEFALAVYIHAYPNSVVAVWVYVGRLVKKLIY
eukprot:gene4895-21226_t